MYIHTKTQICYFGWKSEETLLKIKVKIVTDIRTKKRENDVLLI